MPIVAYAGTTGRSQGFELLLAVGATLLLVRAVDATEGRRHPVTIGLWWLAYAIVAYLGVLVLLWSALVVAAHAVTVVVRTLQAPRRRWPTLVVAASAMLLTAAALLPFVRAVVPQSDQIGWLQQPTLEYAVVSALRTQFFSFPLVYTSLTTVTVLACVTWALAALGLVPAVRARSGALAVLLPWLVLPTIVLLGASRYLTPVYTAHYVTYSAAPLAILVGAGVALFLPYLRGVVSALLLVAFLVPAGQVWWTVRAGVPTTPDFGAAARLLSEERRGEDGRAGLILGQMRRPADQLTIGYPEAAAGLDDLSTTSTPAEDRWLFAGRRPPLEAVDRTASLDTVWYVADNGGEIEGVTAALQEKGFTEAGRTDFRGGSLLRFTR